jgi:hypothetical protein
VTVLQWILYDNRSRACGRCRPIPSLTECSCCVSEEFAANMFWALSNPPQKLTPEKRHTLSWEAAMERYVMYGATA